MKRFGNDFKLLVEGDFYIELFGDTALVSHQKTPNPMFPYYSLYNIGDCPNMQLVYEKDTPCSTAEEFNVISHIEIFWNEIDEIILVAYSKAKTDKKPMQRLLLGIWDSHEYILDEGFNIYEEDEFSFVKTSEIDPSKNCFVCLVNE